MKIVVIGGTGLIGSKLVKKLGEHGHEAVAAAPSSGVNSLTGEGLADALKGASVVVEVSRRTAIVRPASTARPAGRGGRLGMDRCGIGEVQT